MANFHNRFKIALGRAQNGDTDAQFQIGTSLCYGALLPKDEKAGLKWLQKAALSKHSKACLVLGLYHYRKNPPLSISWLKQASALNEPEAPYFLWKTDIHDTAQWELALQRQSILAKDVNSLTISSLVIAG